MKAQIMAIGNVTPDSFYAGSRLMSTDKNVDTDRIVAWARQAIDDGADILDLGACSTRPNSTPVESETEWARLAPALGAIREALPQAQLSLDTFRPEIARRALEDFGEMIINDISGGNEAMYSLVRDYQAPYVWTLRGNLNIADTLPHLADIRLILDPGFGFGKTLEHNYELLNHLEDLKELNVPLLVGVSRKSMVYKLLGGSPAEALNGTTVLHTISLLKGAHILRVHDVKAAVEAKRIVMACQKNS